MIKNIFYPENNNNTKHGNKRCRSIAFLDMFSLTGMAEKQDSSGQQPDGNEQATAPPVTGGEFKLLEFDLMAKLISTTLSEMFIDYNGLLAAIEYGNVGKVEGLLKAGENCNDAHKSGTSPLMLACRVGNPTIVKLLIEYGADPYWRSPDRNALLEAVMPRTTIQQAVNPITKQSRVEMVEALLDVMTNVAFLKSYGWAALKMASTNDEPEILSLLIAKGIDVNAPKITAISSADWLDALQTQECPLYKAARQHRLCNIRVLLMHDADVRPRYYYDTSEQKILEYNFLDRYNNFKKATYAILFAVGGKVSKKSPTIGATLKRDIPQFILDELEKSLSLKCLARREIRAQVLKSHNNLLSAIPRLLCIPLPESLVGYILYLDDMEDPENAEFLADAISKEADKM